MTRPTQVPDGDKDKAYMLDIIFTAIMDFFSDGTNTNPSTGSETDTTLYGFLQGLWNKINSILSALGSLVTNTQQLIFLGSENCTFLSSGAAATEVELPDGVIKLISAYNSGNGGAYITINEGSSIYIYPGSVLKLPFDSVSSVTVVGASSTVTSVQLILLGRTE